MTLIDQLAADLTTWMDAGTDGIPRVVMLWLDPEGEFSRLLSALEPKLVRSGIDLLRYDPANGQGLVALKFAAMRHESDGQSRVIVYLPGFDKRALTPQPDTGGPALWSLYEYRYKGAIWGIGERWHPGEIPDPPRLGHWLYAQSVRYTGSSAPQSLTQDGADSLLARYAERLQGRPLSDWPHPLRTSDVHNELAGDARDRLASLLRSAENEVRSWDDPELIVQRLKDEYGFSFTADERDPQTLSDTAAVDLAITDAWDALDRPEDFPFRRRLPRGSDQRERQLTFLREQVLPHSELRPGFAQRIARLESDFDLSAYAAGTSSTGIPCGFPHLAQAQWSAFLEAFDNAKEAGMPDVRSLLEAHRVQIDAGCASPWEGSDDGSDWAAIRQLVELDQAAEQVAGAVDSINDVGTLIGTYTEHWWKIDWQHLKLLAIAAGKPSLRSVRAVGDLLYFDHARRLNERLARFMEVDLTWPPPSTRGVASLADKLWRAEDGPKAVIVCDSLRWDFASVLSERLRGEVTQRVMISSLPSITPIGMTALLPLGDRKPDVSFPSSGAPQINLDGQFHLHDRAARKRFLVESASNDRDDGSISFMELREVLTESELPSAPILAVFDTTIDDQGHTSVDGICGVVDQLIERLRQGINRLHDTGYRTVHIVTDHGFLLLPPDMVHQKGNYELRPEQFRYRSSRWAALKDDAPVDDLIKLPLPLNRDAGTVGFPRGVQSFTKPSGYMHGGISLQECVIPYLVSQVSAIEPARLSVELSVNSDTLTTGTVLAMIQGSVSGGQQSLGGPEPVNVQVWAETADTSDIVTNVYETKLDGNNLEQIASVFLTEGLDLRAGTRLAIRAVDADTQRELSRAELTLAIDWD